MRGNNISFGSLMNGFVLLAVGISILQEFTATTNTPAPVKST